MIGPVNTAGRQERVIEGARCQARVEGQTPNAEWDAFLRSCRFGQYQQSSLWADYKQGEGWTPFRMVVRSEGRILGGFQLLTAQRRLGHLGYVTKGPVMAEPLPGLADWLLESLLATARELGLRAMIVQPPDASHADDWPLAKHSFVPETLMEIIRNNLVVDLSEGMEGVGSGMSRSMRKKIRQARDRGSIVREATREDLPRFFELMSTTCRRQGEEQPNPADPARLAALWDAFQPKGGLRVTLCCVEGTAVAGLLCLIWGNQMTLWKKGWNETHGDARPNELLYAEAFEWAASHGMRCCDFGAVNPAIAERLLSGEKLSEDQLKGRDYFNLSFGGKPVRLPEAMIWFDRAVWTMAYRAASRAGFLRRLAARM